MTAYLDNLKQDVSVGNKRPRTLANATHILGEFRTFAKKKYLRR
jgi:hypothetical protein